MNARKTLIASLLPALAILLISYQCAAQEATIRPGGCVALDKKNPPLFISYERPDDKAWDGFDYVAGALLRLNNNSNCVISLTAPPGYPREVPPTWGFKDGKRVRLPEMRIGSIKSGTTVDLYYLTKYPNEASLVLVGDFHVIDELFLNNGDFIFFSVPLKTFKRDGQVRVPFIYEWESGTPGFSVLAVEHYLVFDRERLPQDVLK
jgi:hypothetical protein